MGSVELRSVLAAFLILCALPLWAQGVAYGNPSILPQCLDSVASTGYGPSTRARECTRIYCARAEYQSTIEAYSLGHPQSEVDRKRALVCMARKERDLRQRSP